MMTILTVAGRILVQLRNNPDVAMTGADLMRGDRELERGSVYTELGRMRGKDLIERVGDGYKATPFALRLLVKAQQHLAQPKTQD